MTGLSPDLCWESAWIQFEFTTSGAARIKVHHCNVLASLICTSVFCNVPNFLILTLPLRSLGKHEIQCSQIVWQLLLVHKKLLQPANSRQCCREEATLTHCIAKLTVGRRSKSTLQMLLKVDTSQNYYISQMCHRDTFFYEKCLNRKIKKIIISSSHFIFVRYILTKMTFEVIFCREICFSLRFQFKFQMKTFVRSTRIEYDII